MIIRILFWIALGTAALSVLVSLLSWFTTSIAGVGMNIANWDWAMYVSLFLVVFAWVRFLRINPRATSFDFAPALSRLVFAVILFTLANFVISRFLSEGAPSIQNGQMVLQSHERVNHQLSSAAHSRAEAVPLRLQLALAACIAIFAAALLNRPNPAPRPAPSPPRP